MNEVCCLVLIQMSNMWICVIRCACLANWLVGHFPLKVHPSVYPSCVSKKVNICAGHYALTFQPNSETIDLYHFIPFLGTLTLARDGEVVRWRAKSVGFLFLHINVDQYFLCADVMTVLNPEASGY